MVAEDRPGYAAPAVDRALDILEALVEAGTDLSQQEIATAIGLSPAQIFRVLHRLDQRGYIFRDAQTGRYALSMRMFDLAHRNEPLRTLITAALPAMNSVAQQTQQSCNLGVLEGAFVRVVAQVESPADFGFRVRVGARFPADETATGEALAAFARDHEQHDTAEASRIRARGHHLRPDPLQPGVTDIVVPILRSSTGGAVAALTIPYVATSYSEAGARAVVAAAKSAGRSIEAALGI